MPNTKDIFNTKEFKDAVADLRGQWLSRGKNEPMNLTPEQRSSAMYHTTNTTTTKSASNDILEYILQIKDLRASAAQAMGEIKLLQEEAEEFNAKADALRAELVLAVKDL